MTVMMRGAVAALILAAITGTIADVPAATPHRKMGGYQVLAADFHVHSHPLSWSLLTAWDTVIQARYEGLDLIAMTPHNITWMAKLGYWFRQQAGGPIVLVGEEITTPSYHLIAAGIHDTIPNTLPLARAIEEIHHQGGIAIAAHPYEDVWPAFDAEALRILDGAEVVRPESQVVEKYRADLKTFFERAQVTAFGSSDYHGTSRIGYSRTYVFTRSRSESDIMDALRAGRTVVYDYDRVYGDPEMIRIAKENGGLPSATPDLPPRNLLSVASRTLAVLALITILFFNRW